MAPISVLVTDTLLATRYVTVYPGDGTLSAGFLIWDFALWMSRDEFVHVFYIVFDYYNITI